MGSLLGNSGGDQIPRDGFTECKSLNAIRIKKVKGKKSNKPRRLPPTVDAFMLHLLTCQYQIWIWKKALVSILELLDFKDYGYVEDCVTESVKPQMMDQRAAPPELPQ